VLAVLGGVVFAGWRLTSEPGEQVVAVWREAARQIAAGEAPAAEKSLSALWQSGVRGGPLAAQTALASVRERRLGTGALWIERARREAPRDPLVRTVRRVLDEEGALPGHPEGLGTLVTWWELLLVAGALWLGATAVWALFVAREAGRHRAWRAVALSFGGLALLSALTSFGVWRSGFASRAGVVLDPVPLRESPDGREQLDLEPGRLLQVRATRGTWRRVGLGGGLQGWVPASALGMVEAPVARGAITIPQPDTRARPPAGP
jgi:Bacterial SH3 domain